MRNFDVPHCVHEFIEVETASGENELIVICFLYSSFVVNTPKV